MPHRLSLIIVAWGFRSALRLVSEPFPGLDGTVPVDLVRVQRQVVLRIECEAWNAIMWAGGPAMPSPGDPQAEPTISNAINGGFDLLEARCNRCDRVSLVPLRTLRQPPD